MFMSNTLRGIGRAGAALLVGAVAVLGVAQAEAGTIYDRIRASGKFIIGVEGTYPPFNFQDDKGNLTGFEVDFGRALAEELKLKPDFQLYNWSGLLGALQSGRVNAVINQVGRTDERAKLFDFSIPYSFSGIQIIVKKGNPKNIETPQDLAGKKVAAGLGTNYGRWLVKNVPTAQPQTYDDNVTPYKDLWSGRIDAILNDRLVGADIVQKNPKQFQLVGTAFDVESVSVALPKDPDLLAAVDDAIRALRENGTLRQISEKWFGIDVTRQP